jgi:hypothetical protein
MKIPVSEVGKLRAKILIQQFFEQCAQAGFYPDFGRRSCCLRRIEQG